MSSSKKEELQELTALASKNQAIATEAADKFKLVKNELCNDKMPELIVNLKSVENLPIDLRRQIDTLEKKLCANKDLSAGAIITSAEIVADILSGHTVGVGATVGIAQTGGGIFALFGKKRKLEALSKKTQKAQRSTDALQAAIDKMEFLLKDAQTINTQLISDSTSNYEMMSSQQQAELLQSVARLNELTETLNGKLSA